MDKNQVFILKKWKTAKKTTVYRLVFAANAAVSLRRPPAALV